MVRRQRYSTYWRMRMIWVVCLVIWIPKLIRRRDRCVRAKVGPFYVVTRNSRCLLFWNTVRRVAMIICLIIRVPNILFRSIALRKVIVACRRIMLNRVLRYWKRSMQLLVRIRIVRNRILTFILYWNLRVMRPLLDALHRSLILIIWNWNWRPLVVILRRKLTLILAIWLWS